MPDTPTKKQTVLIVDDDQFLVSMYAVKFKNSGFETEAAASAEAALRKLRDGLKPDAVLVDIVMPGTDGLELVKRLKDERLVPLSRVIMLTNQGQQADIDRAKSLGVAGYIVKASTIPSEVVAEVKKALDKKAG